jgi:hypothetical protein
MLAPLTRFPQEQVELLRRLPFEALETCWKAILTKFGQDRGSRLLALDDRFYLLTVLMRRPDAARPWIYDRCREVEAAPDGRLDLWAREHYKSTVITFAGVVQEILRDPGITVGIFSHTKPTARKFLAQIKLELESNRQLIGLFPDILWDNPMREAPRWSEDKGLVVKRKSNPKEATLEAHGLVDGQPTGAHFALRVYDDVVTLESINTPEQVSKTTYAFDMSDNLGARGDDGFSRMWAIGTRYSHADTYQEILDRGALIPRIYAATHDGSFDGRPVFLSQEVWEDKKRKNTRAIIAAQQLQNPMAGNTLLFNKDWLRFSSIRPATLNVYLLCDPASSRKKTSDRTAMVVLGVDSAWNVWLLDGYCHRMSLAERWMLLRGLRNVWLHMPGVQAFRVGYEKYGMQSDIEHFELEMQRAGDIFEIVELNWPREGPHAKYDRIQRNEPLFRNGRFWMAAVTQGETKEQRKMREAGQSFRIFTPVRHKDENGDLYSLNKRFIEEYLSWPFGARDDFVDVTSRIYDIDATAPVVVDQSATEPEVFVDGV